MKNIIKFFCVVFISLLFLSTVLSIQSIRAPVVGSTVSTDESSAEPTPPSTEIPSGLSLASYLIEANKRIVQYGDLPKPTDKELSELADAPQTQVPPSNSEGSTFNNPNEEMRSITWNKILTSGNHSVKFNKVRLKDNKEYELAVIFLDNWRSWVGHRAIEVKVNGQTVQCQSRWSIGRNLSFNHLVLSTGLDQSELCQYTIGNNSYALNVENFTRDSTGRYSMVLRSAIIPDNCPDTISGNKRLTEPAC
jgi:hypothetical protein